MRARSSLRAGRSRQARSVGRRATIALGLVALGLIAAFALARTTGSLTARSQADGDAPLAPNITAPLIDGGTFDLARERGKPVLVLFTASWCVPCVPEVNKMAQLETEFASRGLRQLVLSIDPGDDRGSFGLLRERTRGDRLQWALDPQQRAMRAYRITATDTKVLIDATGRVTFTSIGPTDLAVLRREVELAFR